MLLLLSLTGYCIAVVVGVRCCDSSASLKRKKAIVPRLSSSYHVTIHSPITSPATIQHSSPPKVK